jgi:hypothetical protein
MRDGGSVAVLQRRPLTPPPPPPPPSPPPPPHKTRSFNKKNDKGQFTCTFGELYDATEQIFEALGGTLKAAKKRGVVDYSAPILLKGAHDKVVITLLKEKEGEAAAAAATEGSKE